MRNDDSVNLENENSNALHQAFRTFDSVWIYRKKDNHGESFMAIFTTLSVVIWFSTGTLGIFATFDYVFTMRVVIYDIPSMAIITRLSTIILFCNLYYILL